MAEAVFQWLSGGLAYDKKIYAAASGSIVPGRLVKKASGSTVSPTSSGDTPCGFAWGLRYKPYAPTTKQFSDGEELAYLWGMGYVMASSDFFMGGTLPSAGNTLYAGDNGMMTTTAGSNKKVGVCERVDTRTEAVGGVGSSQSVALVRFDINPYGT
jgi:hypothetical protein